MTLSLEAHKGSGQGTARGTEPTRLCALRMLMEVVGAI
jgi:hypothetical protein